MINKKNELRAIDDLELKEISGGFAGLIVGALWFGTLAAIGTITYLKVNHKS